MNAAPSQLDLDNMRDAAAGVRYRSALENIADWRNVNISGEHELGLRDIIQSMIDSAVAALESPRSAGNASAWRVWWVSLNTSRSELFEDHDKATDKARETGGCVIPLYASQPSPAATVETKHKPDMCPTCGINRDSPFPCEHPRSSSTTEGAAIEFEYTNWEGRKGIRQAIPLSIRFGKSEWHGVPQWLMLAYDIDKRAEREYAMADMQFEDGFLPGIDLAPNEPQQPEHLAPGGFCRYCGLQGGHSRMCQMAKHHG
ncbi:hypothetical protein IVB03_39345 [Bradyrhizobium sp. 168]|uniref:hypothetical protein n=1 Tax=Bradyrhizobium sp. 168 TaxID=2782639 RepID=UPI001FFC1997|nr:hypothetical protein [Bradyrhizobium sp. 168]MCK1585451.1 hypothetical protein [Bradyrhizobium sp. 168]